MHPATTRSRPYDMGVLLVHGIGEQQKGETLLHAGQALVDVLGARLTWLRPKRSAIEGVTPKVELRSVTLNRDASEPAQADIDITGIEQLRRLPSATPSTSRWLLAESWWAESFAAPGYLSVFGWVLEVLPGTIVTHYDRRLRRTLFRILNPDNLDSPVFKYLRLVWDVAQMFVAMCALPPLLGLIALTAVIGFFPIPFADTIARTMQRIVAAIVGDSYALLGNPLTASTITTRVRRDIQFLAERCDRVVVVAHSQGGAIAQRVVREDPLIECELLITYGSGLHKLALVEDLKQASPAWVLWIAVALSLCADVVVSYGVIAGMAMAVPSLIAGLLLAGSFGVLTLWLWNVGHHRPENQEKSDKELFERRFALRTNRVEWFDISATEDPVSNGPLLDEYRPPRLETHQTSNLASPIWDHTSYWENRDDFVSRLARLLMYRANIRVDQRDQKDKGDQKGKGIEHSLRQHVATARRRWRVSWRRVAMWAAAVSVGCVAVRLWTSPPALAVSAYELSLPWLRQIPLVGERLAPVGTPPFHSAAGVLVFLALFAAAAWGLAFRWARWNALEMKTFFNREPFTLKSRQAIAFGIGITLVPLLGTMFLFGWWPLLLVLLAAACAGGTLVADAAFGTHTWESIRARAAGGPIADVRDRWERLEERNRERNIAKGRRWPIFWSGLRGIEARSPTDRKRGEEALARALDLGVSGAAWRLGDYLKKQGRWDDARSAYQRGCRLEDTSAAYALGELLLDHFKEPGLAMAVLRTAAFVRNDPFSSHLLGSAHADRGEQRLSRLAFRQGAKLSYALAMTSLAAAYLRAEEARRERAPRSAAILRAGAKRRYQQAIERGDSDAARRLGELLVSDKDVAGAIAAYEAGVRLRDDRCAELLAMLFVRETRDEDADGAFRFAIEFAQRYHDKQAGSLTPSAARSACELARRLEVRGAVDPAIRLYRYAAGVPSGAPALMPSDDDFPVADAAVRLGQLLLQRGEHDEARLAWGRAILLGSVEARVLLVTKRLETDQSAALEHLGAAFESLERDVLLEADERARLCLMLGDAYAEQYQHEAAIAAYRLAVERVGAVDAISIADAGSRLADLIVRSHKVDAARALAGESWRVRRFADRLTLARFLLVNNDPTLVAPLIQYPAVTDDTWGAGLVLEAAGATREAIDAYDKAMMGGSLPAAERLIALSRSTGDLYHLEKAERHARLLGAGKDGAAPVA